MGKDRPLRFIAIANAKKYIAMFTDDVSKLSHGDRLGLCKLIEEVVFDDYSDDGVLNATTAYTNVMIEVNILLGLVDEDRAFSV